MAGLERSVETANRSETSDPIVFAAAARAHKAAAKRLSTIATDGEFSQQIGRHEGRGAGTVIREYVPKDLKRYKMRERTGEDFMSMIYDRREEGFEDI